MHRFWAEVWRRRGAVAWCLWPLSLLYCAVVVVRRILYRAGWLRATRVDVPVVVVGNLTVGGTGKTPLVAWLAGRLLAHGFRPGIVSRGYAGGNATTCRRVDAHSDPRELGDEPVMLARETGCPVVTGRDRVAAARTLLAGGGVDVVLSDDGLQHLALARTLEIVVIDGARRYGNGMCLPAGPLREPVHGAAPGALRVCHGTPEPGEFGMALAPLGFLSVRGDTDQVPQPATALGGRRVHAVAGVGHPERFFATLEALGLEVSAHAYPDHYPYNSGELDFGDGLPVVMTAKDAVKCRHFARAGWWYLAVRVQADAGLENSVLDRLKDVMRGPETA